MIKRSLILFCIISSTFQVVNAQTNFNNEWIMGILNSNVIKLVSSQFKFDRYYDTTNSTKFWFKDASNICDSNGKLRLISNGFNVLDSGKNYIDGLDSIGGRKFMKNRNGYNSYSQYSIFLPMSNQVYYFVSNSVSDSYFTYYQSATGVDFNFDELMYTKIDMKGNGGLGVALQREVKIIQNDTLSDVQMMACKHGNGKDWWLFKQGSIKNKVYKFLFTQDSVINYGTQQFPEPLFSKWDHGGQSMFSQDGTKYATTCRGTGKIFLADFDRCTGVLSNPQVLINDSLNLHNPFDTTLKDNSTEGLAFSPNGRFLYVSMASNIVQFDLQAANIQSSKVVVAELDTIWDAFQMYSSLYLGPDNKLYIGNWSSSYNKAMSYFDSPNAKGLASNFCPKCLRVPKYGSTRPPTMPNYDLGADNCWPLGNEELGPESYREDDELVVYPNPASTVLYIQQAKGKKKELYNSVGQLIGATVSDEINVVHLAKGMYYIRCENKSKKVIIE
jgi:hypothetical protein